MSNIILRPYQQKIIEETREAFNSGKRSVLIQLRTGGGKTAIAAYIIKGCSQANNLIWFCCHRKELVYQTSEALKRMDIKHSFIAAGMPYDEKMNVQVCSVPTVINRYDKLPKPDWIIWDETHLIGAKTWKDLFHNNDQARHIGLSATPIRTSEGGLGEFYSAMVRGPEYEELVRGGYLSQYKAFAAVEPDLKGIKTVMGDYANEALGIEMSKPTLVGSAVKEYLKHGSGKSAVVFAVNVNHSKLIMNEFLKAGILARHVDGVTDQNDRDQLIKDFKDKKFLVLCNVNLLSTGFDFPGIEVCIMLRPTKSLSLYLQQVGRALRPAPGKDFAIILDHAGNLREHNLPDAEHDWSLDKKKLKRKDKTAESSIKICNVCFAANESFNSICSNCLNAFEVKQRSGPEQVDGDLTEIDKLEFSKQKKKEQSAARTLEQLIELAKKRGYKNPEYWSRIILKSRGGRR